MASISKGADTSVRLSILAKQTTLGAAATAASFGAIDSASAGIVEVVGPNTGGPLTVESIGGSPDIESFFFKGVEVRLLENSGSGSIGGNPSMKSPGEVGIFKQKIKGSTFVKTFDEGDVIGPKAGPFFDPAFFYIGENGPFAEEGTTDFIGLFVETFDLEEFDRYYGWAEVTRGSVTIERAFFEDSPNTPIQIPFSDPIDPPVDVPEPATLPLMALGAAGLLAMRRRSAA
ncbi:MAG: PEP-CTERM sorting domain-containing protein [Pseudomonadota bacterium]